MQAQGISSDEEDCEPVNESTKEPIMSMLGLQQVGETKKCGRCCKLLNVDCFDKKRKSEVLLSKCRPCVVKHSKF